MFDWNEITIHAFKVLSSYYYSYFKVYLKVVSLVFDFYDNLEIRNDLHLVHDV